MEKSQLFGDDTDAVVTRVHAHESTDIALCAVAIIVPCVVLVYRWVESLVRRQVFEEGRRQK